MCRWFAYIGSPVPIETFLIQPGHSLIDQSLNARMGVLTTNGDGCGLGWYNELDDPGLYRSTAPAWNDQNLRELATHVRSRAFFAHIRASTGTPIQQTNCHPFRHDSWLWMHNGVIRDFDSMRRDLIMAVDPELFNSIQGSTDSEVMFYLALTLGLIEDPIAAVERMAGLVEQTAERHNVENPLRMSLAVSDGERLWAFRYASGGEAPSLFHTTDVATLRMLYPGNQRLEEVSESSRLIVSEPLTEVSGVWNEIQESSCCLVDGKSITPRPFEPRR